ncbi:MAG: STAS/SEC14 domain-containing protein [Paracoccaceae bacterium]
MFNIAKPSENRVNIEIRGSLDAEAMRLGLDDLIEKSEGVQNGRMFYKISEFSMPSLGAFGVEMSRLPKLFGLLGKFDKCAVLCDSSWIRTAAAAEGALFPGLEIKSFEFDQDAAAEAWLNAEAA